VILVAELDFSLRGSLGNTPLWPCYLLSRWSGRLHLINRLVMRVGVACCSHRGYCQLGWEKVHAEVMWSQGMWDGQLTEE